MALPIIASGRLNPFAWLTERLVDPARREPTVILALIGYTALWTLYGVSAKSAQDVHFDMAEVAGWSRDLALGYPKHPPLAAYVVRLWFGIFPNTDWAYDLLAIATAALALWIAWRVAARYLAPEKSVAALAMLTLVPFFNFHALKFNMNTVLEPCWAATAWFFLRSIETRRPWPAALAGALAAIALLGKYWSVFLVLGLGLAALLDTRRAAYFRSPAPWITVAVGLLAILPHGYWLVTHDYAPVTYAAGIHGAKTFRLGLIGATEYLTGAVAFVAVPVGLILLGTRPSRAALADMMWPSDASRRLVAMAFWFPLLLPAIIAPLTGMILNSLWTTSAWALLPVVMLSSPAIAVRRDGLIWLVGICVVVPFLMLAASPVIATMIHRAGVEPSAEAHARLLAPEVEKVWRATTAKPLRIVGGDGDLAFGAAFYLPERPSVYPWFAPAQAPWIDAARIARQGIALLCMTREKDCVANAQAMAAKGPPGQRAQVTLSRSHFGIEGKPESYLILAVPPR